MACLKAINVKAEAYTVDGKPILGINWDNQGIGSETDSTLCSFYVNGIPAWDTKPENTQFPVASTGKTFEAQSVSGGISTGQQKTIFIRIYCKDGTHVDSDSITYTIPALVVTPTHGKGHK